MSRGNRHAYKNGIVSQFSADNQPEKRGRKPRVFSEIVSEWKKQGYQRVTVNNIKDFYEHLLGLPLYEVIQIAGKPDDHENTYPTVLRAAAQGILGPQRNRIIQEIIDRVHGRPKQHTEISGLDGAPIVTKLVLDRRDVPPPVTSEADIKNRFDEWRSKKD